jgi:hypothetical protein
LALDAQGLALDAQGFSFDAQGLALEAQGFSFDAQGLVSVVAPESCFVPAAQGLPQAVTIPMPKIEAVARVMRYLTFMKRFSSLVSVVRLNSVCH